MYEYNDIFIKKSTKLFITITNKCLDLIIILKSIIFS